MRRREQADPDRVGRAPVHGPLALDGDARRSSPHGGRARRGGEWVQGDMRELDHRAPGARLVLDVFSPSVRTLARADGVRHRRDALSFVDPDRGVVHVDVAETYDAAAQVTRGRWYFSTDSEADFLVAPLEIKASSLRSCRCCSRSAVCGSSSDSETGPVRRSPQVRRSSSTSANPPEPGCLDPVPLNPRFNRRRRDPAEQVPVSRGRRPPGAAGRRARTPGRGAPHPGTRRRPACSPRTSR